MDAHSDPFNMTEAFSVKYRVANMIFPNKTVIVVTKHHTSNQQQLILLVGMAFIGGIAAGFLVRCIYYGIVKFFLKSMDQIPIQASQRPDRGNVNLSFVDDNFRHANDEPPDYITVMADPTDSVSQQQGDIKSCKEGMNLRTLEELPPCYLSVVPYIGRTVRSASA